MLLGDTFTLSNLSCSSINSPYTETAQKHICSYLSTQFLWSVSPPASPDLFFQRVWQINLVKLNSICTEALCAQKGCSLFQLHLSIQ